MIDIKVNCLLGQKVYKACPKCNDEHVGSCEYCAWRSCCWTYCDIEPRIYSDGSFTKIAQAIPKIVKETNFVHINERWNITYFRTKKACEQAISEYRKICKIEDRHTRKQAYDEWIEQRKTNFNISIKENKQ